MAIVACSACGAKCRLPVVMSGRIRCGGCKREFTPQELSKATPESPAEFNQGSPNVSDDDFDLDPEDDGPLDDEDEDE